jgi:hypothetical protein
LTVGVAATRGPANPALQIDRKFCQAGPSQPKRPPNFSKKKAWISLDSLVRNEPFQWVTLTPWAFFFFILLAEANNNFADP